ncbi:hypothetical protein UlMin_037539 [Ulmus minor]
MLRFLFLGEERIDVRNMIEHKRSPCSVDQSNFTSLSSKCQKPDLSISSKDKKENLAARIVALQQLVSPYGKTDTASVLNEAMEYIQFLHEQVQSIIPTQLPMSSPPISTSVETDPYSEYRESTLESQSQS